MRIYTDGSCRGRKVGLGVYMDTAPPVEISEAHETQHGTALLGEVEALKRGVRLACALGQPAVVLCDAPHVVEAVNAPRQHLSRRLRVVRELLAAHPQVTVAYVKGHSGNAGNDRAHWLALAAARAQAEAAPVSRLGRQQSRADFYIAGLKLKCSKCDKPPKIDGLCEVHVAAADRLVDAE